MKPIEWIKFEIVVTPNPELETEMPQAVDSERKESNWTCRVGTTHTLVVKAYSEFDARVKATHAFKNAIKLTSITAEPCDEVDPPTMGER